MLVLSRKPSQQIMIGPDIVITVVKIDRNQVRLGIQAPTGVPILRHELVDERPACEGRTPIKLRKLMSRE
jgi:carbon storage regulator